MPMQKPQSKPIILSANETLNHFDLLWSQRICGTRQIRVVAQQIEQGTFSLSVGLVCNYLLFHMSP